MIRHSKRCLPLMCIVFLSSMGCGRKELEPTPPERAHTAAVMRPTLQFKKVLGAAGDVQEAGLTMLLLPRLRSRLEIQTIIVQAGKPVTLPMRYEGLMELRAGSLSTGEELHRQVRQRGEMWQVAKGERVTLEAFGELAVVRAIYLAPGTK
jgi:hypothetical protein